MCSVRRHTAQRREACRGALTDANAAMADSDMQQAQVTDQRFLIEWIWDHDPCEGTRVADLSADGESI